MSFPMIIYEMQVSFEVKIEQLVNDSMHAVADAKQSAEQHMINRNTSNKRNTTTSTTSTLRDTLFAFPWKAFEDSVDKHTAEENTFRQDLIDQLQKYAYQEPLVPVNASCKAPPLLNPMDILCSNYPEAFLPNKYATPVKVAHAIQLGFDADTLEIHLNEIYDVVDYFFILEATKIQCRRLRFL